MYAAAAVVFVFDEEEIKDWAPSFARYVHTSVDELRINLQVGARYTVYISPHRRPRWADSDA